VLLSWLLQKNYEGIMMAERLSLKASVRPADEKPKKTKQDGYIPSTLYGHGRKPQSLRINQKDFQKIFQEVGQNTMIDIVVDNNQSVPVLIHQYHKNPLKDEFWNVEFYAVRLTEKIEAEIPIEIIGESPALKLGGSLFVNLREINVRCLPQDLIKSIKVDISSIEKVDEGILVKGLDIPSTIEVLVDLDEVVVKVLPPVAEEVEEVKEEAAEGEPELIGKKDKEDEDKPKEQ
jgi:large subunit ribosomal protein L25